MFHIMFHFQKMKTDFSMWCFCGTTCLQQLRRLSNIFHQGNEMYLIQTCFNNMHKLPGLKSKYFYPRHQCMWIFILYVFCIFLFHSWYFLENTQKPWIRTGTRGILPVGTVICLWQAIVTSYETNTRSASSAMKISLPIHVRTVRLQLVPTPRWVLICIYL